MSCDYLRAHPDTAREYGNLKKRLAVQHPDDIDAYIAGKTGLLLEILGAGGFQPVELGEIARINSV